jgi:polyhydroxybutyrate depolymerase
MTIRFYQIFILSILLMGCLKPFTSYADEVLRDYVEKRVKEKLIERLNGGAPVPNLSTQSRITKSGDYISSMTHQGLTRTYKIHVPDGYRPSKPATLIVAFHGGGGDMNYMARDEYYGLISKADKENFIVVFPNGYSRFNSGKLATWNAGNCCGSARDKTIDDVGFINSMVATLKTQLTIHPQRVFAIGMSNGGMMAYRVACDLSLVFRAVASVTGTDNTISCNPKRPVPILHIHALDDTHVLFNGGAGQNSFRDKSKVTDFTSVPDTIRMWGARNKCQPEAKRVLQKSDAYCDEYRQCADNSMVKVCVTATGGHSWPGGYKPRGDIPPSQAISANDEIWNFFQNYQ